MKPHETFELITLLVCEQYNVSWKEIFVDTVRKNQYEKIKARKVVVYLTSVFLGRSFPEDALGIHDATVLKHISWAKNNEEEYFDIYCKVKEERTFKTFKAA